MGEYVKNEKENEREKEKERERKKERKRERERERKKERERECVCVKERNITVLGNIFEDFLVFYASPCVRDKPPSAHAPFKQTCTCTYSEKTAQYRALEPKDRRMKNAPLY